MAAGVVGCGGDEACNTVACAEQSQGSAGLQPGSAGQGGGGRSGGLVGAGDVTGAGGQVLGEGEACREVSVRAETSPVNIHIMLDRSVSMLDPARQGDPASGTRWDAVTAALRTFLGSELVNGAQVSIQFFGLVDGADDCQVAKYAAPAVPMAPLEQNRAQLIATIDATRPGSLTPTAPALQGALEYALSVAQQPENAERATVVVLATDGLPSECGITNEQGMQFISFQAMEGMLREYSQPAADENGMPVRPAIRTYVIGTADLASNVSTLAAAGRGQVFLVGQNGGDVQAQFLDAMLSIVSRPLTCELDVPQTAPDTGERVDFERVKVSFTGAASGLTREIPRTLGVGDCAAAPSGAWYYDDPMAPEKIFFCPQACAELGAGTLKVELGCAPQVIVR